MTEKANKPVQFSVVVVSFNEPGLLNKCLDALCREVGLTDTQVLVVHPQSVTETDYLRKARAEFPLVQWINAPERSTVPTMRLLGINASSGEVVALLEDDCIVQPSWRTHLLAPYTKGYKVSAGPVLPDEYERGLDWAVFFCDYAKFMPPFQGSQSALPGNNFSYGRAALTALQKNEGTADGLYEVFANSLLKQQGFELHANNGACVKNIHRWTIASATSVPFHHGRAYAAMRFGKGALAARLFYSCLTMLLPGLQTLRISRQVLARRPYRGRLFQALPWIIIHWTCWSMGEFMGYLLGPGRSLEQWR